MQILLKITDKYIFLIILFLIIYLLFPTHNSSIDAYNYAANIKWQNDLFFPHHLLYNYFQNIIYQIVKPIFSNIDVLALMKVVNAFFAAGSLLVFAKILKYLDCDKNTIFSLVLFAGSCFGFMRYATENETYIIPLFWSLLSSFYFLKYLKSEVKIHLLISGVFASIACLFHQIHIFWYIGLLMGILLYRRRLKELITLALPSIVIPLAYFWAFQQKHVELNEAQNLWQFIFYDYYFSVARVHFGWDNILLGIVNFIRSFIQVHGIIPELIKTFPFYSISLVVFLFFAFSGIRKLFKDGTKVIKLTVFIKVHLLIFALQFAFAIFSEGNAEFMIMLPMLCLIIISSSFKINYKVFIQLGIALLVWNFTFAIFPNNHFDFHNNDKIIKYIENKPENKYILSESTLIQNILYYKSGILWRNNIYKSPATLHMLNLTPEPLINTIDSCLENEISVYTDCINENPLFNRKTYLSKNTNDAFFSKYRSIIMDSSSNIFGSRSIQLLKKGP